MGERAKDLSSRREKQQYMALSGWMDNSKPSFLCVFIYTWKVDKISFRVVTLKTDDDEISNKIQNYHAHVQEGEMMVI